MDLSIISRDTIRSRGAKAFDNGRGIDAHGMNPDATAIEDWQAGWRARRDQRLQERFDRATRPQAQVCLAEVSPP
ncbi:hypothetical protein [Massilia sp. ZL223]|uniref:hypothetical protein n=1 Tax=Massilia sp. ZL223 TaxID=2824904 RepID=UPI001B83AB4F|nr:hypothetical protein [Massilia sp. ZL223]MBQ5963167.1 hypothetical protein [Massilia sp. ZL223]